MVSGGSTRGVSCVRGSTASRSDSRLWVFDVVNGKNLYNTWVAHGKNSGEMNSTSFSNNPGSLKSSLGVFLTANPYIGKNGYSLRLNGLERGVNDNAARRAVVDNVSWIFNRLYTIDVTPFNEVVPGLASLDDIDVPATIAAAIASPTNHLEVALGSRPLPALVSMADEACARLHGLRLIAAIGTDAIPPEAMGHLMLAITTLEAVKDYAADARPYVDHAGDGAIARRVIYARILGSMVGSALIELARAFNRCRDA